MFFTGSYDPGEPHVEAVRLAQSRLVPARMGYGTGVSYINVNRNIIDPKTRRWWEGPNYDGPSDKTLWPYNTRRSPRPFNVALSFAMSGGWNQQVDQGLSSLIKVKSSGRILIYSAIRPQAQSIKIKQ